MNKFRVGDKVKIKREPDDGYTFTKIGSEGVIQSLTGIKARIKFSKITGKQPSGENSDTWDIAFDNIEIIGPEPAVPPSPYRRIVL